MPDANIQRSVRPPGFLPARPAAAAALAADGSAYAAIRSAASRVVAWSPVAKSWSTIGDTSLFSDLPTSIVVDPFGHPLVGRGVG